MKRILLYILLILIIGIITGINLRIDLGPIIYIIVGSLIVTVLLYIRGRKINIFIYLLIFMLGFFLVNLRIYTVENSIDEFIGKNITISGQISADIERNGNKTAYTVYVDSLECEDILYDVNCKIRVIDYKNSPDYIKPYNYINICGNLDRREIYKNTNSFSYNNYLLRNGISGVLLADYKTQISSIPSGKRSMLQTIYNCKIMFENKIFQYIKGKAFLLMKGMLFGDTSDMEEVDYKSFQDCGLAHVFAVSGFNIWILYYIMNKVLFFIKQNNSLRKLIIIFFLGIYSIMAGASASVIRSFIMITIIMVGSALNRIYDPLTSLSFAAFLMLLFNPLIIIDPGFQLSFVSVVSMILLNPKLKKVKLPWCGKVKDALASILSVQIGIFPIMAYYFNSYPVFSILANIFIAPVISAFTFMGFILIPVSFVYHGIAVLLGKVISLVGELIFIAAGTISNLHFSNINLITPSILHIIIYYVLIAIIFKIIIIKSRYRKAAVYITLILLLCCVIAGSLPSELMISFIDVGQGDSILIKTPDRKYILVDGGGKHDNSYSSVDIGEDVLIPYLYRSRINKLDMIISTHSHEDHLNGLIPVMKTFKVDKFIKSNFSNQEPYLNLLKQGVIKIENVINVAEGDVIEAGKYVEMYVLNPSTAYEDENDDSIVLRLVFKNFSMLLTGDISINAEENLMDNEIRSDVLKVPHHGSAGSTGVEFLEKVNPSAAVICVGRNNFGHPADITIKKIIERGIKLYRTDINGEVIITTRGEGFKIKTAM